MRTLHFTFGPVQAFVSQARRTRDLWAGSYLLSYLAGSAMLAVETSGGEIERPQVREDPLMTALREKAATGSQRKGPRGAALSVSRVGSLPNRFQASVPDGVSGVICVQAIQNAWQALTEVVWAEITSAANATKLITSATRTIWDRQIAGLWEFSWVLGDSPSLLDQRKNMRNHFPPAEPGVKCTQCGQRESLHAENPEYPQVRAWWGQLAPAYLKYNLRQQGRERLCAVCMVNEAPPILWTPV